MGLPKDKSCKLIVTNYNIPQVSLTYQPLAGDTTVVSGEDWKVRDVYKRQGLTMRSFANGCKVTIYLSY